MGAEDVKGAVAAYYAAVNSGDFDAVAAMFAADAAMYDPVGAPPATDDGQRRQRYAVVDAAFDDFRIEPTLVVAGGSEAAARWTARGRAKNGRGITFEGISTFAFDSTGKISRMSAYWEPAAIVAAMQG